MAAARLLKHAQLTKQFQLEMKVIDSTDTVIFHLKTGFLPVAGKFALFHPTETGWHAFVGARRIIDQTNMEDDDIYTLQLTTHIPGDAQRFTCDGLEDSKTTTGANLKTYLYKILKKFEIYSTIEYEK